MQLGRLAIVAGPSGGRHAGSDRRPKQWPNKSSFFFFFRAEELELEKETLRFQPQEPAVQERASLSSPKPQSLMKGQVCQFHNELPKLLEETKKLMPRHLLGASTKFCRQMEDFDL